MKHLNKITFTISLLGIFILLVIASVEKPKKVEIGDINSKYLNKNVEVSGNIFNIRSYDKFEVISINDSSGKIDLTVDENINLENEQKIVVIGKVTEYNELIQVQADKIIIK